MTKTEVDRLGERLRRAPISDADLRLLDAYRRSFAEAYEFVIRTLRERGGIRPTGRPAKSTTSTVEKLRRESIRLTQMQDIAGCRAIVSDIAAQDRASRRVASLFDDAVKYGGGPEQIRSILARSSHLVAQHEMESAELARLAAEATRLANVPTRVRRDILELQRHLRSSRTALARVFRESIASSARL